MNPELRRVLDEREGAGDLTGPGVWRASAEHAVCGDVVEIACRIDGGVVVGFAWRASGCPATLAVAAAARQALVGAPPSAAAARLRARLAALGDLAQHERHAERLLLTALAELRPDTGAGA